jgi:hypothetical protein
MNAREEGIEEGLAFFEGENVRLPGFVKVPPFKKLCAQRMSHWTKNVSS